MKKNEREYFPVAFVTPSQYGGMISGGDRIFKLTETKSGGYSILVRKEFAHKTLGELMDECQEFLDTKASPQGADDRPQQQQGGYNNNRQQAAAPQQQRGGYQQKQGGGGYAPRQQSAPTAGFPKKDYRNTQKPAPKAEESEDAPF